MTTPFTQANFLALIRSAEGTPYKFGGVDPFHGGADCSGLIWYCAKQLGVTLPRTTSAEWAELPNYAAWEKAPVGSIIEFDVPADGSVQPSHVGVVVGGGFMIDDPHTGAVVRQEAIPNEPGVIWPIGYCLLPFVADVPTPTVPEGILDLMATDNAFAVRYLYLSFLCREPDAEGFATDVAYLNGGGTLNQLLTNLQDSPEGKVVLAARRKALGLPAQ